ncbi:type I-F CRISPR-associated helicase Cas3f [Amphritea pacifica]|uniref:type I-F CRISPR-associated helicase Cas3f n=1 Tax=Amphritea pacifica TaxID=2811233 RepID=UPI0019662168|nr:type I-F CRISPR-associated helicase Cas3f [Amphritea pacifica]MBN1007477.1 type I-F CRISPR-associated helicase Cas3 [Amphritea pacifica]
MMVTFVSQCEKKALARTRRVLDAFADRIGDNTWQTIITQEGLLAVKKLLRKTASKSTAVSCHWIRSRSRSDLVWVVGNKRKFNELGQVPVNSTHKAFSINHDETKWVHAHSIQIIAVLSGLLHDIGKATIGFQNKLLNNSGKNMGDPYRHEWLSLRLFQAMIHGCKSDDEWLTRLMDFDDFMRTNPAWLERLPNDALTNKKGELKANRLDKLPPLAKLVAWLIVTHHRMPTYLPSQYEARNRQLEQRNPREWGEEIDVDEFFANIEPFDKWVKNGKVPDNQDFWCLKDVIMASKNWQKGVRRWARKAKDCVPLRALATQTISDPLFMNLSRLCLMLADHNYSSLPNGEDRRRVKGDVDFLAKLAANTDKNRQVKQALDEHLIGVGEFAKRVALEIPMLVQTLPSLSDKLKAFTEQTRHPVYSWQNGAFALAQKLQPLAQDQGFFGVNMASTGRGKTLANARIMYALANPETGARFTIALGLRVLTLQTGQALRQRLTLDEDDLAVLVGGSANRALFDMAQTEIERKRITFEEQGSESLEELLDKSEWVDGDILPDEFGTLVSDPKTRQLLYAPVVSCTVDHIMQASECVRGGRYIAPTLRLLTSDLVLDEPDDFDQSDLPALSRLVHMAGLYGSKVLLSSATLTPDLIAGLYQAYAAGRKIWNSHMGIHPNLPICCAWFDEYKQQQVTCANVDQYTTAHLEFAQKRAKELGKQRPRRHAEILPLDLPPPPENEKVDMSALAAEVVNGAIQLHRNNSEICPKTGKQVSIGLVRMANVKPIIGLVRGLYQQADFDTDTQIHLCCYHAKQLLMLRDALERRLDRILTRVEPNAIFSHKEIQTAICTNPAKHHLFIVVASPVAEVGRDHDYDWAIVEPSSMRSLIQLAGRVWRHRPDKVADKPNMLILDRNILALKGSAVAFVRPGFENADFVLSSHFCKDLISADQLANVDSVPRIVRSNELQPTESLADLEHAVMQKLLNNRDNFVSAFWRENNGNRASAHLQKISPFRASDGPRDDFVCLPVADDPSGYKFTYAEDAWEDLNHCTFQSKKIRFAEFNPENDRVSPWLTTELDEVLQELADKRDESNVSRIARQFATVSLENREDRVWWYHPWLGFWQ